MSELLLQYNESLNYYVYEVGLAVQSMYGVALRGLCKAGSRKALEDYIEHDASPEHPLILQPAVPSGLLTAVTAHALRFPYLIDQALLLYL